MSRWLGLAFLCWTFSLNAQKPAEQKKPAAEEQAPPEEDDALKPKEYAFNPLQAEKEVRVGDFYFRKGSFRAAAQRYREATRWNPNLPEAFLRLGEAEEKQKDWKEAREAYAKFLELAADDKRSPEIRKKVEKLSKKS
ncbi:MAG TPA: tetratricopeptide repeat protein [Bryobacteraceae bacterium]|nr:tetratricopeptide repeat protein [Bryobacteraceae bacterium]